MHYKEREHLDTFHFCGKAVSSNRKSNGIVLFTGNFSGKKEYPTEVPPLFSVLQELSEYHRAICVITLVPHSLMKYTVCLWKHCAVLLAEYSQRFLPKNARPSLSNCTFSPRSICLKKYFSVWRRILTAFSI